MRTKTKSRTGQILMVMHMVAWLAFVGFMIEAGAILTGYVVSCINPAAAKNLYMHLNLEELRQSSFWQYTVHVFLLVLLPALKAYVWFLLIKIASKINLSNPFTMEVVDKLEKISYVLLAIWVIGLESTVHLSWIFKTGMEQSSDKISGEYLFMAGLVFIISQVFKRGVELQSENELTI